MMALVFKLSGSNKFRVTDEKRRPLKTRHGVPLDRGGYDSRVAAERHAGAVNLSIAQRKLEDQK